MTGRKRCLAVVAAVVAGTGLWTTQVRAQSLLTLGDHEVHVLDPGIYRFDAVELGREARIEITGTTDIWTAELATTDAGAKIEYRPWSAAEDRTKILRLVVGDAGRMRGMLSINGSGGPVAMGMRAVQAGRAGSRILISQAAVIAIEVEMVDEVKTVRTAKMGWTCMSACWICRCWRDRSGSRRWWRRWRWNGWQRR